MLVHSRTGASIWGIAFALVALSGSGTMGGANVARLVLGGLVAPTLLFAVLSKLWKGMGSKGRDAQLLALADAQDVMRVDSDVG